jgi:anti-sigma regulatory factor (Ser/Thr protein kinase)
MAYYILSIKDARDRHMSDLLLACAYLACSFCLDFFCVRYLSPFPALLVGDAIVMTFTLLVSRQLWFQRLLGVFVPMVFLTCGLGHLLEGMSYWQLTYPLNVPWSMVTADIGFAVLVNAARYPAFIRGTDVVEDIAAVRTAAGQQAQFFHNVLYSVTDGRFRFHADETGLPVPLGEMVPITRISRENLSDARHRIAAASSKLGFSSDRTEVLSTTIGEAMMNAVVHGADATVETFGDKSAVQVWIRDHGVGISLEDLPSATLRQGWSSRGTLGMGFSIILSLTDGFDLVTSNAGTTAVITVYSEPTKPNAPFLFAPATQ